MLSCPSLIWKHTNSSCSVIGSRKIGNTEIPLTVPEGILRFSIKDSYIISHYGQRPLTLLFLIFFCRWINVYMELLENVRICRNISGIHAITIMPILFDIRSYIAQADFEFTGLLRMTFSSWFSCLCMPWVPVARCWCPSCTLLGAQLHTAGAQLHAVAQLRVWLYCFIQTVSKEIETQEYMCSDSSCRKIYTALSNSREHPVLEKLLTACWVGIFPMHRDHITWKFHLP